MYSFPALPAFGVFRSPIPMISFLTLLRLTPAEVNSLSRIGKATSFLRRFYHPNNRCMADRSENT